MEQSSPWKANSRSPNWEILWILWKLKVHYCVNKGPASLRPCNKWRGPRCQLSVATLPSISWGCPVLWSCFQCLRPSLYPGEADSGGLCSAVAWRDCRTPQKCETGCPTLTGVLIQILQNGTEPGWGARFFPPFCAAVLQRSWNGTRPLPPTVQHPIARCGAVDGARSTEPRDVQGTVFAVVRIHVGVALMVYGIVHSGSGYHHFGETYGPHLPDVPKVEAEYFSEHWYQPPRHPEDGSRIFLRNIGTHPRDSMVS